MNNYNAQVIPTSRYKEFHLIASDLLDTHGGELFNDCVRANPELAIFYEDGKHRVIGLCFGMARKVDPKEVILQGIAIDRKVVAKGLGSKLLADFERVVKEHGFNKISLGSAPDYVEHFYQKNGYIPTEYLIYLKPGQENVLSDFEVLRTREDDGQLLANVRVRGEYSQTIKHELVARLGANSISVIFEKQLV